MALLICIVAIANGTSLIGLYNGVIGQPLRFAGATSDPGQLSSVQFLGLDLVALATASGYFYLDSSMSRFERRRWAISISLFSILVGFGLAWSTILAQPLANTPLGMLAFTWVALIGVPREESDRATEFARRLLPAAVLQALHAYPVAQSQIGWSSFLLLAVGAICISNGVRGLRRAYRTARWGLGAAGAVCILPLLLFAADRYNQLYAAKDGWVPLGLNGAIKIRVPPKQAALYQQISAALTQNCKALAMLRG